MLSCKIIATRTIVITPDTTVPVVAMQQFRTREWMLEEGAEFDWCPSLVNSLRWDLSKWTKRRRRNTWKRFEVLFSQILLNVMRVLSVNVWPELVPPAKYLRFVAWSSGNQRMAMRILLYVRETGKIIKNPLFSFNFMQKRRHYEAVTALLKLEIFNGGFKCKSEVNN